MSKRKDSARHQRKGAEKKEGIQMRESSEERKGERRKVWGNIGLMREESRAVAVGLQGEEVKSRMKCEIFL